MKIKTNSLLSWEPMVITITTEFPVDPQYVSVCRGVVQNALNRRDLGDGCNCSQKFLDVSRKGAKEISVLCEWLCSFCLPSILRDIEDNMPGVHQIELGLAVKSDSLPLQFLSVSARNVVFESGDQVFVPEFSISIREIMIAEFSAFCEDTGYKTVAEDKSYPANYLSNFAVRDVSEKLRRKKPATHLSFNDAKSYCEWAGKRLPTEAEFLAASLMNNEFAKETDQATEEKIQSLIAEAKQVSFMGTTITGTAGYDDTIIMRAGPLYVTERSWRSQVKLHRFARDKNYFDATTNFHLCERT